MQDNENLFVQEAVGSNSAYINRRSYLNTPRAEPNPKRSQVGSTKEPEIEPTFNMNNLH